MRLKALHGGVEFRPHFKTHFSAEIADWYREAGVRKCTVSSVEMATYFAENGWSDMTIAFPFNRHEMKEINHLSRKFHLNLLIEDSVSLKFLERHAHKHLGYFLKVDIGTHRTGLDPHADLYPLMKRNDQVHFRGFLAHAGHTYSARSRDEIITIHRECMSVIDNLAKRYLKLFPDLEMSYGDTPSCSTVSHFEGINEIRPGNFIFYDYMQQQIGSCDYKDVAVCMACPVVAKHPDRKEVVVYGGAVHFSKDSIEVNGQRSYGLLVKFSDNGWDFFEKDYHLVRVSQEHGVLRVSSKILSQITVGDIVGVLPVHSCLAANLMGSYLTLDGRRILQMEKNRFY